MERNESLVEKIKRNAVGIGIAAAIVGIGALSISPHFDRDTYRATVTDKERVVDRRGDNVSSKYLVFTELEDGSTRVFENTDSLLEWKWGSSDIQGELKVGETYDISTYGWRVPVLSCYENIVDVEPVGK